jgi:hypothetical protein
MDRFKADKGFKGGEESGGKRDAPVQFERAGESGRYVYTYKYL